MSKLVRDKIPVLFPDNVYHTASSDEEYWAALKAKLKEEVEEFILDQNEEELADVQEVIKAICAFKGYEAGRIRIIQTTKAEKRGEFSQRIILDTVTEG